MVLLKLLEKKALHSVSLALTVIFVNWKKFSFRSKAYLLKRCVYRKASDQSLK